MTAYRTWVHYIITIWDDKIIYCTMMMSKPNKNQTKRHLESIQHQQCTNNQDIYDRLFFKQCWNWGEVKHISNYINALNWKKSWGGFCRHIRKKTNIVGKKLPFFLICIVFIVAVRRLRETNNNESTKEKYKQVSTFLSNSVYSQLAITE